MKCWEWGAQVQSRREGAQMWLSAFYFRVAVAFWLVLSLTSYHLPGVPVIPPFSVLVGKLSRVLFSIRCKYVI